MAGIKKSISYLIVTLLFLSNIAFAQFSDSSQYEGKPIDPSKEGIDYYREGDVIVYPHKMGSKEKEMMERFNRGEFSEEEMRKMAKEKFGDKFDEMKFKKEMVDFKEKMDRKEAFSYEHEGYYKYDFGPSYEGYSKEHMIFGMIFEHIGDDIDPREIKQYCNEPEKIADTLISKLKEKVGDLQSVCGKFAEMETKCEEHSKKACSQIGTAFVREDATEMEKISAIAYSCPVNKDAIVEACKKRSKFHLQQRIENSDEECRKRFDFEGERLLKECERFRQDQICDREKYMERCIGPRREEPRSDIKGTCAESECGPALGMPNYLCPDGKTTAGPTGRCLRHGDGRCGWEVINCPKSEPTCPEYKVPTCEAGQSLQKKTDEKGCTYYYCEGHRCPEVSKPTCAAGERLEAYYDNKGCVTSYQCVKYQTTCPTVSRPTCAEGQHMTTKYGDKGCVVGYECVTVTSSSSITGHATFSNENIKEQCEKSWSHQQKICSESQNVCDKESFIQKCKDQERKNFDDFTVKMEKHCSAETMPEIKHAEQRCSRLEEDRQKCLEHSAKRCEHMKGLSEKCKEFMTEEKIREFIIKEAKKRCKFIDIIEDEEDVRNADEVEIVLAVLNTATEKDIEKLKLFIDDLKEDLKLQDTTIYKGMINPRSFGDVKLLPFVVNAKISTTVSSEKAKEVKAKIVASTKVEETASKLVSLRNSDVPSEYLYIIEDKASEVLDAAEELEDVEKKEEKKGIGYKIKRFFGLAKKAEQEEIKQLEESKSKLQNSIDALTKLIDEVPSDIAKAILKEQVENLKKQREDIDTLIKAKEKKSKGLLGWFG